MYNMYNITRAHRDSIHKCVLATPLTWYSKPYPPDLEVGHYSRYVYSLHPVTPKGVT